MKKTKRYCISMREELHDLIMNICEKMGMDFSSWLEFIARDKIAYFLRNKDKYFTCKYDEFSKEWQQWEDDLEEVINIAKDLWSK